MKAAPLISVIIPVYNVEKYLDRCLTSVTQQSMRELEIILVDDGSPDACGRMCDDWAARDDRIRVLHKPNGGLRSAVIAGVQAASAGWCGFVDSDDFVLPAMFEQLYGAAIAADADCAMCGYILMVNGKEKQQIDFTDGILDAAAIEQKILTPFFETTGDLNPEWCNPRWNKLYKTDLYRQLEPWYYPGVSIGEDIETQLLYLPLCQRVVRVYNACNYIYEYSDVSMSKGFPPEKASARLLAYDAYQQIAIRQQRGTRGLTARTDRLYLDLYKGVMQSDLPADEKRRLAKTYKKQAHNWAAAVWFDDYRRLLSSRLVQRVLVPTLSLFRKKLELKKQRKGSR